jgi:hypothetical protein
MKAKDHYVLEMCIKDGINIGWARAHKYTETPDENLIKQEIETEISNMVYMWFDMGEKNDT